ncbi:MAG TPA: hypothetical protein VD978_25045 [Azospirillum sp.]|nr:hypothetical protein [Azospirillum sp.]
MQFRERRRVIQVIRTTYDPGLKRGRSELVGKLDKGSPEISEKLQNACTPAELAEIADYLSGRRETQRTAAVRTGAEALPDQMRKAAEYFQTHQDDKALVFATEIRAAWDELKAAMRKAGFSKSKVRQAAKAAQKPAQKTADAPKAAAMPPKPTPKAKAIPPAKTPAKKLAAKPTPTPVPVEPPTATTPKTPVD